MTPGHIIKIEGYYGDLVEKGTNSISEHDLKERITNPLEECNWMTLYSGDVAPTGKQEARCFSPQLKIFLQKTNIIRISMDCTNAVSWSEIDAIKIRGREILGWKPKNHLNFSLKFRRTVFSLLLVRKRGGTCLSLLPKFPFYYFLEHLSLLTSDYYL